MEDAQLYVSANAMQKRDALLVLSEYLPQMAWSEEGENVLDIGCGSGDVTRNLLMPLLPRVEQVVGVDVSRDMVSFASKTFEHNSLSFRQLDIERAVQPRQVFPDGFSKVFSMYCLHWVKDQERCLTNIYQLLQPGGEALLVFLARNPLFTMYENMSMKERWQSYMQDVSNFVPVYQHKTDPAKAMADLAEDVGFEVVSCEAPELEFVFENINYLKNAIKAVNPFLKRVPREEQDAFLMDCLNELARLKTKRNDGKMVARYSLMVAHLQRGE
ncbi:juvenile hormone acid O-methyltransferase-like [Portunus trituberculatus]|uniref:Juvenile hormone acid methyltransferase n=1 Tax=Portunus trituberculatus TaxID=210409 RepID=A0A1L2BNI6_PORTR|nr:juvenile hormone acid O-methyltransferase-like [Portunus trituberculatus]ALT10380.1 juvenile hormone acid methyltransferase [Portunus trituberculatus]